MSVRFLADYMAASDQARRTILRGCKFRAIARIVQHDEAKLTVSKYMLAGVGEPHLLEAEADYIRGKMADDDFDRDRNDINADYVYRFSQVVEGVALPKGLEWLRSSEQFAPQTVNGVRLAFRPDLLTRRIAKSNILKAGAMMLRYKKGSKLSSEVAAYQSSIILGVLRLQGSNDGYDVDPKICLTLDAHSGVAHPAPTNAVSRFNNAKAACATIAEAWDKVQPPDGAVL